MKIHLPSSIGMVVLLAAVSAGQPPRQYSQRDGQRPSGPPQGYSAQEIQSRVQRFEALLKQCDANGDGTIQPSEVPRDQRYLYERLVRRVGLDPNTAIPVARLRELTMQRYSQSGSGGRTGAAPGASSGVSGWVSGRGATGAGNDSAAKATAFGGGMTKPGSSAVPGFGSPVVQNPAATPTASAPATAAGSSPAASPGGGASAGSPGAGASSSSGAMSAEREQRIRRYAEYMLRSYDTNKNGVLDKDEWSTRRPDLKAADRNNDDVITLDELTVWLIEYTQKGGSHRHDAASSSAGSQGISGGPGTNAASLATAGASGSAARKYYRALTPAERLPAGLPEWFARKDANGDGQVSMAEFSSIWNDDVAAEFAKYDLNNDGVITPAECLEAMKR